MEALSFPNILGTHLPETTCHHDPLDHNMNVSVAGVLMSLLQQFHQLIVTMEKL
jgi:hypothetical protein